jgi:MFS superfamily sulfate permease-like transporter
MNSKTIGYDIKSGIVVFLVALPLCLGIALACQAPLISGIIAGVIGGIVVTSFSGSVLSVSGPAAGLTAIVLSAVATLGSFQVFLAAVMFAGVLQIVLGILKAGSIGNYIPNAVIKGMLAGIGIILIIKQIPHLIGYDKDPEGDFYFERNEGENTFSDLFNMIHYITPGAVIIGIVSFAIIIISERAFYKQSKVLSLIPGPLLVVIAGILLNVAFRSHEQLAVSSEHLVNLPVISNLSDLNAVMMFPDFSWMASQKFWVVVVTIAIVASLESLLSIEATDKLDPKKRDSNSNKELMAQGIGNVLCGICGALPVTAVIVRSSANINAGAQTKFSAIFHAFLLVVTVLAIPTILMLIPNASLAAILIATGYKLAKPSLFKEHYEKGYDQLLPFVITIVVMLLTDLLKGVGAGLIVSIIFIIRANISYSFETAKDIIDNKLHYMVKLPQHITFFNKGFLIRYFSSIKEDSIVIIDGSINKTIDKDAKDVIQDFLKTKHEKNITVNLIDFKTLNNG